MNSELFLLLPLTVVAVSSTAFAIICLRALCQVLWASEVLRWKWPSQVPGVDGRRLEVVEEGLSLVRGAQLAIDATLVSTVATGLPGQAAQHSKPREGEIRGLPRERH